MKKRSLLILATAVFFSLLNWECSSNKVDPQRVDPRSDLSAMYRVSKLVSGSSTLTNPLALIGITQLTPNQIQIFFAITQDGKESSKDFSNFDIEPIKDGSYAILRAGTRVGLIDRTNFLLDLDANSQNRFYVEAQK